MEYSNKLEQLAINLFEIDAVKFGEFITKSGIKSPVYFDLRVIVSYPHVMELISLMLLELAVKESKCDHLCGVPYTALPVATLLSIQSKKPMLMRRKEAKAYGTKKMIEGHYKPGESCLIIEDVITSGSSVMETVNDLRKEALIANEAVVILDREQGGREILAQNGIEVKSLFKITELLALLIKNNKISEEIANQVGEYINSTKVCDVKHKVVDRATLPYEVRADLSNNPTAKQLFTIMAKKKTNLCLSVDLTSTSKILDLLKQVGEHICLVKTHIDIIEDFNMDFVTQLKQLADRFNFLILEDRKYADIGNTVYLQHVKGIYKVATWADCITVHSLPGEGILKSLKGSVNEVQSGVFLLAEMSSEGNLITPEYTEATVNMASKYQELMVGFVCQNKSTFKDPGLIQLTPGVQLQKKDDGLGQIYNTPEKVVIEKGADIAVVGRGIVAAGNPVTEVVNYKNALWSSYLKRISGKIE